MMASLDNIMDPEIQASPLDFKRGSVAKLDQIGDHHHAKEKYTAEFKTKVILT